MTGGGTTPRPDPTILTDRAIAKAIEAERDYVDGQLSIRDERLKGIDEATRLRLAATDHFPEMVDEKIKSLADLTDERFSAFERLRVEQKKDTKDAVDAALSAAKEAVKEQTTASGLSIQKSETATGKQLEQLGDTSAAAVEGLRRSIEDAKERERDDIQLLRSAIAEVATTANGTVQKSVGAKEDRTSLYATIAVLASVAIAMVAIIGFLLTKLP